MSNLKPCIGCKHLVAYGLACKADEQLTRVEDPLTGRVSYIDLRFPDQRGWRPTPGNMRLSGGRCGPERKLFKPKLLARIFPRLYD